MLDRNFKFIDKKYPSAEKVKTIIDKCCDRIKKEDYDAIPNQVRISLEIIMENIIAKNSLKPRQDGKWSLGNQVNEFLHQYGSSLSTSQYLAFKNVHSIANAKSHNSEECPSKSECIYLMKNIRIIIEAYFKIVEEIKFDYVAFEENIYWNIEERPNFNLTSNTSIEKRMSSSTHLEDEVFIRMLPICGLLESNNDQVNTIYRIPLYQRGYSWDKCQILALISDIECRREDKSIHYFGVIAIKEIQDNTSSNNEKIYEKIIDGQQRLTTSMLLLCAIRDVFKNEWIKEKLLIKYFLDTKSNHKTKLFENPAGNDEENKCFQLILRNELNEFDEENISKKTRDTKYYKNYSLIKNYLFEKQKEHNLNEIGFKDYVRDFANTFIEKFNIALLNFDQKKYSSKKEMEIFENLNSKGKNLSAVDLIKNHLFNLCSDDCFENKEKELLIVATFNNGITSEIKAKNIDSELQQFYESLIHYFIGVEVKNDSGSESASILKYFRDAMSKGFPEETSTSGINESQFKKMITKIQNYLKIFLGVIHPENDDLMRNLGLWRIINLLSGAKNKKTPLHPLMYFLFFDILEMRSNNFSPDQTIKRFAQDYTIDCIKILIKHFVVKGQGDSGINRIIYESILEAKSKIKSSTIKGNQKKASTFFEILNKKLNIKFNDFEKALRNYNKDTSWTTYALIQLVEWDMSNVKDGGSRTDHEKPSIEHIMPRKIDKWIPDLKDWGPSKNEEDIRNMHDTLHQKLGNLLIISKRNNAGASNLPFKVKLAHFKNKCPLSPLYTNKDVDIDISRREKWKFENINTRTTALEEYILKRIIIK